jgi:tRNA pseudouridine55 synthase
MNFEEGAVILINKPLDWTSFQAVNKLKYALIRYTGNKKLKIGHAGTLDPKATGLLIICTGKKTKTIDEIQKQPKAYTGKLILGATTPCYDTERPVDKTYPWEHIDLPLLNSVKEQFIGDIMQRPPIFSAIKRDGKPLYEDAHKGKEVALPEPRPTSIYQFDIISSNFPEVEFLVRCSKGTYIRSLAHDFGQALGSGAYLTALCRTKIGDYKVEDAISPEEFVENLGTLPPQNHKT